MSSSVEPPPEDQHVLGPVAKLAVELGGLMVIDPYHQLHLRRTHSDQPVLRGVHQETPQTLALVGGPNGQVVQPAAVPIEADQDRADDLPTGMSNQHLRAHVFASPSASLTRSRVQPCRKRPSKRRRRSGSPDTPRHPAKPPGPDQVGQPLVARRRPGGRRRPRRPGASRSGQPAADRTRRRSRPRRPRRLRRRQRRGRRCAGSERGPR